VSAVDGHGHRLTAAFYWRDDRYGHSITLHRRGKARLLLESIEGDGENDWPPSPPFQRLSEVNIESDVNRGHVTMLVGGAGKSHWAMTVSARDHMVCSDPLIFKAELFFDIACRLPDLPLWLGSSYYVLGGQAAISDKRPRVRVPVDVPCCEVIPENAAITLENCAGPLPILRLETKATRAETRPETIRWQYAIRLCPER
jgi:hypothetical protein